MPKLGLCSKFKYCCPFGVYMYINKENKIIYTEYEKNNGITVDRAMIAYLKENKFPLFYNNIHFIQKYYREYSNQQLINKCIADVYSISNNQNKYYHQVTIPKRNGEDRILNVPNDDLKKIQKYILNRLFVWYEPLDCVMGYVKKRGIKENARIHLKSNYILKLDISDFFGSIHFGKVVNNILPDVYDENLKVLIANLCMLNGSLPQGAPTSPIISNMVMHKFDEIIFNYCKENNLIYTRYADDMFISSKENFDYKKVLHKIEYLLKKYYSMKLNKDKTHYLHDGLKEELCGIISNEKMQVSKKYRDSIRQEIYYLDKYGVEKHIYALYYDNKIERVLSPLEYYQKLLGKIRYVLNINNNDKKFIEYKNKINGYIKGLKPQQEISKTEYKYPEAFKLYLSGFEELHFDEENASLEEIVLHYVMNNQRINDDFYDEAYDLYRDEIYDNFCLGYLLAHSGDMDSILRFTKQRYADIYESAYDQNNLLATYLVWIYYSNLAKDVNLQEYWANRLASKGIYRGQVYLLIDKEGTKSPNIKFYADKKDAFAQFAYGRYFVKDEENRIKYILSSANNGYIKAFPYACDIYDKYGLAEEEFLLALRGAICENEFCMKKVIELSKKYNYSIPEEVEEILCDNGFFDDDFNE